MKKPRPPQKCIVYACLNNSRKPICWSHWGQLTEDELNLWALARTAHHEERRAELIIRFQKALEEREAQQEKAKPLHDAPAPPTDTPAFLYEERQRLDRRLKSYQRQYKDALNALKKDGRAWQHIDRIKDDFNKLCRMATQEFNEKFHQFDVEIEFHGLLEPDEFDVMLESAS
jgi:hypothetical protein